MATMTNGVGPEFDPDWYLTESQQKIRADLIELCKTKIKPIAVSEISRYFRCKNHPIYYLSLG